MKCCGFIGHCPSRFCFGWDEEDTNCMMLKTVLLQQIQLLRMKEGYSNFYTVLDTGVGLWSGEIINGLRDNEPNLLLQCIIPHEECSTKWTPDLRERYFRVLVECTHMSAAANVDNRLALLKAYIEMINFCDTMISVYDPESNRGDFVDQAMLYAAGAGKRIILIHPDTMKITSNQPVK